MLMELNETPPKREMSKMLAFFALLAVFSSGLTALVA
jgi:hypothetical protein